MKHKSSLGNEPIAHRRIRHDIVRDLGQKIDEINWQFDLLDTIDKIIILEGETQTRREVVERAIPIILEKSMDCLHAEEANIFAIVSGQDPIPFPGTSFHPSNAFMEKLVKIETIDIYYEDNFYYFCLPISTGLKSLNLLLIYKSANDYVFKSSYDFSISFVRQCEIMFRHWITTDLKLAGDGIVQSFFNKRLEQGECWISLADKFSSFLPSWMPLSIEPAPLVQILTSDDGPTSIVLRTNSYKSEKAGSFSNERVLLTRETICGLLVEAVHAGERPDYLYVNPSEDKYRKRYSAYLHKENPKSELIIPIYHKDSGRALIGMMNLEHPDEAIFNSVHIEMMQRGVEAITPMVVALLHEEIVERHRSIQHFYVLQHVLHKLSRTYRHKIGQHVQIARLASDALRSSVSNLPQSDRELFSRMSEAVDAFFAASDDFALNLPDYISFSAIDIVSEVRLAFNEFDPAEIFDDDRIRMTLVHDGVAPGTKVYATPLIREHIYNLLKNSMDAVRDRLSKGHIDSGEIKVSIVHKPRRDLNNKRDAIDLVAVEIADNGGGLSPDIRDSFGEHGHSTKLTRGGSGYGVAAAVDYLTAISGEFSFVDHHPHGLTIEAAMELYTPEIHINRARYSQPSLGKM
jgi:signal transduction histidine kinase